MNKLLFLIVLILSYTSLMARETVTAPVKVLRSRPAMELTAADTTPASCPKVKEIEKIIEEAISLGAPIYNEGLHMACYRVYEWASYKILYEYGKQCKEVESTLKAAIDKSHGDYSDTEKAWIMRAAFDKILGQPTRTGEPQKGPLLNKG